MSTEKNGQAAPQDPIAAPAPRWQDVCRFEVVPRLGARRIDHAGFAPVAVFRAADDEIFALVDRCPHKGGPLSQGIVFGRSVACPLHNWAIGLADGCAAAPDSGCTPCIDARVVDGVVQLDLAQFEPLVLSAEVVS
jgi:nitrite reductase (NADH) small subunit